MKFTALLVLGLSVTLGAQTVERTIDLSVFGWGPLETPLSVETDGDFSTREWLVRRSSTNEFRVVSEIGESVCVGPWFRPVEQPFAHVDVQRVGVVHKLVVRQLGSTTVSLVALNTPTCL